MVAGGKGKAKAKLVLEVPGGRLSGEVVNTRGEPVVAEPDRSETTGDEEVEVCLVLHGRKMVPVTVVVIPPAR